MERPPAAQHPPQLPIELWQRIAENMTSEEWASVSNTCRATSLVQPAKLKMTPRRMRDFHWLVKHWKEVQVLSLDMHLTGALNIARCGVAMLMGSAQLSHQLKHLELSAPVANGQRCQQCIILHWRVEKGEPGAWLEGRCSACERLQRRKGEEWSALLAYFLLQTKQVEILSFKTVSFEGPMVHTLKHLLLEVNGGFTEQGCRALQQLHSLETLHILHDPETLEEDSGMADDHEVLYSRCLVTDSLNLQACERLSFAHFAMVVPRSLKVRSGCHVSVECDGVAFDGTLEDAGGLEEVCKSWHVHDYVKVAQERLHWYYTDLVRVLSNSPLTNITTLRLDWHDASGCEPLEIGECLQNLADLDVRSAYDVNVGFTDAIYLKRFVVMAKRLCLEVPHMTAFAASIKQLYICWQQEPCPVTAALCERLAVESRTCPDTSDKTEAFFPVDAQWMIDLRDACCCGACHKCLGLSVERES